MALEIFVSTTGDDRNAGTQEAPFATLHRAQQVARATNTPPTISIRSGTYYLDETLSFSARDSGNAEKQVIYRAYPGETVTLSGGVQLICDWQPYHNGIMMCHLPQVESGKLNFDQLFINGKRQIRARYPNHDPSDLKNFSGYIRAAGGLSEDVLNSNDGMTFYRNEPRGITFDPATFSNKRWKRHDEAIIHIFQAMY